MKPVPIRRVTSCLAEVVAEGPETLLYRQPVRSAPRAWKLLRPLLEHRPTEEFWVLLLDSKHRILGLAQVSVGSLSSSLVHPREVFGPAVRMGAAAVLCAHNHPSGDPEPSAEDVDVTRRLLDSGRLLGIPLLDHIVLGDGSYLSLRERMGF